MKLMNDRLITQSDHATEPCVDRGEHHSGLIVARVAVQRGVARRRARELAQDGGAVRDAADSDEAARPDLRGDVA